MIPGFLVAQTFGQHIRSAQFYEILGWILCGLAFAIVIAAVVFNELRRKRRNRPDGPPRTK